VCIGVMILRYTNPTLVRPFKTPLVPLVPILGILVCSAMIVSLSNQTLLSAFVWMLAGLVIYFIYSKKNSKLQKGEVVEPVDPVDGLNPK
jgi:basic amino acid/polyamine antiporter, APA family